MNSKWRPMMGWMYMLVCTMDFVVFPVLWSLLQSISHGQVTSQWQPLTLQGAGLFHIAMGGVLGLAAYGRTQEKLNGANNGGLQQPGLGTTYIPPTGNTSVTVSNQPPAGGFGGASNGFSSSTGGATAFGSAPAGGGFGSSPAGGFGASPSTGTGTFGSTPAAVTTGFGGKPAPTQPAFPAI
jgi:nuclear pore complex protein Nup98-Nup96